MLYIFSFFTETVNIKLNVYKLKDSSLGLYHTGVEFGDLEYTYCHGMGIAYHRWFSVGICKYRPGYKSHDLL